MKEQKKNIVVLNHWNGRDFGMGQSAEATAHVVETDNLDEACEQAIDACGGDARSAVRSLLILTNYLEHELELSKATVSLGFGRGRAPRVTRAELADLIAGED